MTAERRRLLDLLAASADGCTEALLLTAHGFTVETLCAVVGAGLASVTVERMRAGGKAVEVTRVRITAGRPSDGANRAAPHPTGPGRRQLATGAPGILSRPAAWMCCGPRNEKSNSIL
jgi:hypothetical protein